MQLHIGVYLFLLFVVRTINLLMTYMQVHLHIRRAVPGNPQGFLSLNIHIHLFYIVFLCIFTNTFSTSYFSFLFDKHFFFILFLLSFFTFCVSLFLFSLSQGFLALNIHIHLFYSLFLLSFFDINFLYIFISSFFFAFTFV